MRSLASAAKLLDRIVSSESTQPLLDELGFAKLIQIDQAHRSSLSLPASLHNCHIARGSGSLRALVFELDCAEDFRAVLNRAAIRLTTNAPQYLWTLVAVEHSSGKTTIAAVDLTALRPRVAALVAARENIVDSDSETICALAAARSDSDILTHCRWVEILGRESVSKRFFRALEHQVSCLAESLPRSVVRDDAFELALLHASRLLFLSFLETKGWLDRDHSFLGNRYADCMVTGGNFHRRVLEPLFFGTLNTHPRNRAARAKKFGGIPFLNGGLFARTPLETRCAKTFLSDESLGDLFGQLLSRYRFTAREDTTLWSEAAIDPEMLGKAFESLMSATNRKTTGAYYTPQSLVAEVAERSLSYALESSSAPASSVALALHGAVPSARTRKSLLDKTDSITVLDPACGSGAFLVHCLEQLSALRLRLGDIRPLHLVRREILTRSIFGVDINPTAVWLCELRLWLSMAIEDPESDPLRVTPLPNLDRNIRIGDSLSGDSFAFSASRFPGRRISTIRGRYTRATGPRKKSLARVLDSIERDCAISATESRVRRLIADRREILGAARSRDLFGERKHPNPDTKATLARLRAEVRTAKRESRRLANGGALPFSFAARFGDVASAGGFGVVIGNPPWIRTHNLDPQSRIDLRRRYAVYKNAAWLGGSDAAAAGRGFGSQVDLAALFVERSLELLRGDGVSALIVPSKLWKSLAGGGVRALLTDRARIRELHDLTDAPQLFQAAVYPSIIIASRKDSTCSSAMTSAVVHRKEGAKGWCIESSRIPFDASSGSPWLLLPPPVRDAFEAVAAAGIPMGQSVFGRPLLGVKTGCNEAFVIPDGDPRLASIEPAMLRRLLRGDEVEKWSIRRTTNCIIWTHGDDGLPVAKLPPRTASLFNSFRRRLEQRSDALGKRAWWMLFRTESAKSDLPRVVWPDIGRTPRAATVGAGDPIVPLNSCYVVRCPTLCDAHALSAILNSPLVSSWLGVVAEPARGNYRRYLGWTMSIVPLPANWDRARRIMAPIAERAVQGDEPKPEDLLDAVLSAYDLSLSDVRALLEWTD
ncbi:MAG: N-6 DNA methylase [Gemmatimonadales bacterium]